MTSSEQIAQTPYKDSVRGVISPPWTGAGGGPSRTAACLHSPIIVPKSCPHNNLVPSRLHFAPPLKYRIISDPPFGVKAILYRPTDGLPLFTTDTGSPRSVRQSFRRWASINRYEIRGL